MQASAAYTIADQATLNARVTPKPGTTITLVQLNGQPIPATSGDSTYTVILANGLNTYTLVATDSAGHTGRSSATVTRDTALPTMTITSPMDLSTIEASSIDILGTVVSAIPLRSVTVNGVSAYVNGGTFDAPNLPVVDGANTFTATATDILGKVTTVSIAVTGQAPVEATSVAVAATPLGGDSPHNVWFSVVANVPGIIEQVTYDFEGSGKNVVTATTIAPLAHTYFDAGIFYPRIKIRTSVGTFSNKTGPAVPVAERLRIAVAGGGGNPLVAWSNLKRCVAAGDFEASGDCLSDSHRDGIKSMMLDLGPQLAAAMLNDFGSLQQITLNDDVATYAGEISTPEGYITFMVDFIKEDGSWKAFSF